MSLNTDIRFTEYPVRDKLSRFGRICLCACLALAAFFGYRALNPSPGSSPASDLQSKWITKPIEDVRPVVDWVLAENPEVETDAQHDFGKIDPPNWRLVHFRMAKEDGGRLDIWLARPLWHLNEIGATKAGLTVFMDLEEMGAFGPAEVMSIAQCPQPPPQPSPRHRLVTGRFVHSAANVIDLHVAGLVDPIGVTANHLIWSADRQQFLPAGDLRQGETLLLADGRSTHISSSTPRLGSEPVYNLEVDGQHVYFVSRSGVLVHNTYAPNSGPAFKSWNQFQAGTKGRFASRAEAAKAWDAYKQANGIVTGTARSAAARSTYLKGLANDANTPSWMKPWLEKGRTPPGYDVDHILPLSVGGLDDAANMRLQLRELHKLHHRFYRPWE